MISILNVRITPTTGLELLSNIKKGILVTPNVDHLVKLQKNRAFYNAYQEATHVVCDSRILYFLSKLTRNPIPETISGSGFFHKYCELYKDDCGKRIFILGGKAGVAQKAMDNINRRLNSHIVVGAHSPSFYIDEKESQEIAKIINRSGANIVMVGLGAPKQEIWITRYKHLMPEVKLWMALGATVDFEAETQKRAPRSWQRCGLEWFYRFIREPRRLFRRYFVEDMKFFWYFGKQLLGIYKNPFEPQT